jgi:hypothetical protein
MSSYPIGSTVPGNHNHVLKSHNEFEENLLMDDLDIDELIECEDYESHAYICSSK